MKCTRDSGYCNNPQASTDVKRSLEQLARQRDDPGEDRYVVRITAAKYPDFFPSAQDHLGELAIYVKPGWLASHYMLFESGIKIAVIAFEYERI